MIAGAERIELPLTVLETAVLPLYQAPIFSFPKAYALQVLQNYTLKKSIHLCSFLKITSLSFFGQVLDLLVSISYIHYCTSTFDLSTLSSSRGLTTFVGISHLEGGFTLRCLQRLSLPNLATLPCRWYDNRYTRGSSIPVLSY